MKSRHGDPPSAGFFLMYKLYVKFNDSEANYLLLTPFIKCFLEIICV
ncbi:hypothetical protein CLV24_12185 [Pontibacter ummariensis]|uniref:Uncharacterized protein n=1 Tax=Pontibacter ummariensis TaxID=1610492 RepID=A0A239JI93_9BACT|nr:hypothetical protein CLV24_12185 [Pontibacter ummariensis]SNT04454.1 hypothetical protein SAMN06296052_12185 [Pontibacter ummariensis]